MSGKKGFYNVGLLLATLLLAGCGYKETVSVDVAKKTVTAEAEVYFNEEEYQSLAEMSDGNTNDSELTKVTVDGKTYYKSTEKEVLKASDLKNNSITLDDHAYVQYINRSAMDLTAGGKNDALVPEFAELTYHFSRNVVDTNGTLLSDGKSVSLDVAKLKDSCFYATFDHVDSKIKTVTFSGVKNKGCYNKTKTVNINTKGIVTDILVNGKSAPGLVYNNGKKLVCNYVILSKEGKHKVTAVLSSGAKKTITVTIDKKKPTTNLKNNKTYKKNVKVSFADKTSGIKKAVLNGKKIKSGYKIGKSGSYKLVLTDKAGNTRTVRFKVK